MTAIRSFPDAPMAYRDGPSVPQRLRAWGANLWRTLQRTGQRRAAFELYALAGQHACTAPTVRFKPVALLPWLDMNSMNSAHIRRRVTRSS